MWYEFNPKVSQLNPKVSQLNPKSSPAHSLPPGYFDRNAKSIVVNRKDKDYSQTVNYNTRALNSGPWDDGDNKKV